MLRTGLAGDSESIGSSLPAGSRVVRDRIGRGAQVTTEYISRLSAQLADVPADGLEHVARIVGAWAGVSDPFVDGITPGRRGDVTTEVFSADGTSAWRMRLIHPDDLDAAIRWTVTATAVVTSTLAVSIRLDRDRLDGTVLPTRGRGGAPGCIRALLEDEQLAFVDGGRRLSPAVWVITPEEVTAFAELLLSPGRHLPVFALSARDEDPIDGGEVLRDVVGCAHVALVRPDASWALDDLLPKGVNVYGGAARLYWPGLTQQSSKWDHPLWTSDVRASRLQKQACEQIRSASQATAAVEEGVLVELERSRRNRATARLLAELERVRNEAEQRAPDAESRTAESERSGVEQAAIAALQEEIKQAYGLADAFRADFDEAVARYRAAEAKILYLEFEVDRLRDQVGTPAGELSEEELLASEIRNEIDARGVVEGASPRGFVIGPHFCSRLETQGEVYRSRAVKACADVVMNAPGLLRRRDDHALRVGNGPNDPQVERSTDGAVGRRCALESNTPGARRIHYWVLPTGVVEFAAVNIHDDMWIQ